MVLLCFVSVTTVGARRSTMDVCCCELGKMCGKLGIKVRLQESLDTGFACHCTRVVSL